MENPIVLTAPNKPVRKNIFTRYGSLAQKLIISPRTLLIATEVKNKASTPPRKNVGDSSYANS